MRTFFKAAILGSVMGLVAMAGCATGGGLGDDPDAGGQVPVDDGATINPANDSGGGTRDSGGGGNDATVRDVNVAEIVAPTDGPLADVTFNPDATVNPGDCPTSNQLDFFFYYLEALNETNPQSCPCSSATKCCFIGLMCVDR